MEGVDIDGYAVVVHHVFAASDSCTDLFRIVLADPSHVEVSIVVGKVSCCCLAYRGAVHRIHLKKSRDCNLGFTRCSIKELLQSGSPMHAWNAQDRRRLADAEDTTEKDEE